MKPAMYIFVNQGLDMSAGKIAAQAGHAATEATLLSHPAFVHDPESEAWRPKLGQRIEASEIWKAWRTGLHYAKYVMAARDNEHIRDIDFYLSERGFHTKLIIDEGHTEVPPISPTALGVALVNKDDPHTAATFGTFDLYREKRPSEFADTGLSMYNMGLEDGKVIARAEDFG